MSSQNPFSKKQKKKFVYGQTSPLTFYPMSFFLQTFLCSFLTFLFSYYTIAHHPRKFPKNFKFWNDWEKQIFFKNLNSNSNPEGIPRVQVELRKKKNEPRQLEKNSEIVK